MNVSFDTLRVVLSGALVAVAAAGTLGLNTAALGPSAGVAAAGALATVIWLRRGTVR